MEKSTSNDPMVISFMTIRKAVGWLGIGLPPAVLSISYLLGCCCMQDSISHYYFTEAGDLFVGTLCAVALFLFTYKGYDSRDKWSTNIAGLFALGVAFIATNNNSADSCSVITMDEDKISATIHYGCAALFFLTLAYISFFLFTKSKGQKTPEKKMRNKIYRTCAVVMVGCLVVIAMVHIFGWEEYNLEHLKIVFLLETLALWAFGLSWLTKGEFLLKDDDDKTGAP
jgi:hypothetical protein